LYKKGKTMLLCKTLGPQVNTPQRNQTSSRAIWSSINPLKPKLNPICYLLALLAHHFLHV